VTGLSDLETLNRHKAQERVHQVNDPHHRIDTRIEDFTPAMFHVEEGSDPRTDEDEDNHDGHSGDED
jgi:hypothetical protein